MSIDTSMNDNSSSSTVNEEPSVSKTRENIKLKDPFWYDDPAVLFDRKKLFEFYPDGSLSFNEKLNAVTRFLIYFSVLLYATTGDLNSVMLLIGGLVVIIFIKKTGVEVKENFAGEYVDDRHGCQMPTQNNPFMNVLMSDYEANPDRPPACNIEDPVVKERVNNAFYNGLFLDVHDLWGKNNSQRQYFGMPSSQIPNNREDLLNWCSSDMHTSKENSICKNDVVFDHSSPMISIV